MNYIYLFLITFGVFIIIDLIWLGIVARSLYTHYIGHHMRSDTRWIAALVFYALYAVGIILFAILPSGGEPLAALVVGGAFGFFCYATYELTNYAVLKRWPLGIVFIDILWGVVLTASVAGLSTLIARALAL